MYQFTTASTRKDLDQITSLVARTFPNKGYWFFVDMRNGIHENDPFFKPEHSHIVKYKGEIVSHIGILTKPMRLHGEQFLVGGIGDVVTHRDHRGQGLSSRLMNQVVQYMQNNDYDFSILSGIPNFYHRFGYIEALPVYKGHIEARYLKNIQSTYRIFPFKKGQTNLINEIYNENFQYIDCSVVRTSNYYYREHLDKETILVFDEKDRCRGYGIFWDTYEQGFILKEAGVRDYEAFKAIISYCYRRLQETNHKVMIVQMPPQSPFIEYLKDLHYNIEWAFPREKEGGKMGRFIKFLPLFEQLQDYFEERIQCSSWQDKDFSFLLETDLGNIVFHYRNSQLNISDSSDERPDYSLSIRADFLFRFFTGYWNVRRYEARTNTTLETEVAHLMQTLFPEKVSFFSAVDYF